MGERERKFDSGEKGGQKDRNRMKGCNRVVVVKLEALNNIAFKEGGG